jgi:group II intron reverse transcriptase/maturase
MDVDEMQTKLATWAIDPSFRFDDVYNLLYDEEWLFRAYKAVESNSGARTSGVDGQTMQDFEEDLNENLKELGQELKSESFDPKPVRRTYIPKSDDEERPLGIPTIKDRIVQEALRMVLEPIYETDFSEYSFGFRPNRRTYDAIQATQMAIAPASKMQWVIDADIKGFFDNVDHQTLEQIIQDRITDRKIRDLIWEFLKAGIMEEGKYRHSTLGTPQGGIVSPILANIYLNELDQWAKQWTELSTSETQRRRRHGKGNWRYVRYADDFLFLTNGTKERAEAMREKIGDFVNEELNLTLSKKKTKIVHASNGFEFLGYHLQLSENGGVDRTIPKSAKEDILGKIKEATNGPTNISARKKIISLNAVLRGWANYYKYATDAPVKFNKLDHIVWERLTDWLAEKYRCSVKEVCKNELDGVNPIEINGITMNYVRGKWDNYGQSHVGKDHPYLDNSTIDRESFPEESPWLANIDDREGWSDARWEALERDDWTCQECGRNLEGSTPHVHHIRPYSSYSNPDEANRLGNLETLCEECHLGVESNRD